MKHKLILTLFSLLLIVIANAQNVGIGTVSPSTLLQVGNGGTTGKLTIFSQDNRQGQLQIGNPNLNAEASMAFISGDTAFGPGHLSFNGDSYVWDIGAGNYGLPGSSFGIGNKGYGGAILVVTSNGSVGMADGTASGAYSTAMGFEATASGTQSTAMGNGTTASGDYSMAMGGGTTASGDNSTAMGNYVSTNNQEGSFIIGDDYNVAITNASKINQFVARFSNGYNLFTKDDGSIGVQLNANDNSWSAISDSTKKEKILAVDGEDFLNKISKFKLSTWNYKGQDPKTFRHYGPMAQDFHNAFGKDALGNIGCDTLINQQDFLGVSFIAIQALEKRTRKIEEQQKQISDLQKQNTTLQQQVNNQQQDNLAMKEQMQTLLSTVASLNKQVQALATRTNNQNTVAVNK
jgi:hypothetical protein